MLILFISAGPASKLTTTLCPLAFSNAGARSRTADTTPWLVSTVSSADCATLALAMASTPSNATLHIVRMTFSRSVSFY